MYTVVATVAGLSATAADKCQVTMTKEEYKKFSFRNPLLKSSLKAATKFMGDRIDVKLTFSPVMLDKIDRLVGTKCRIEISPNLYSFKDPVSNAQIMGYKFFISTIEAEPQAVPHLRI